MATVTSRIDMGGSWYGQDGIRRGDQFEVPTESEAKKLVAQGLVDYGKVSLDKLGRAGDEDTVALQRILKEEHDLWVEQNPEAQPKPDMGPIRSPYRHKFSRTGWGV